jgi:hypothetical protein
MAGNSLVDGAAHETWCMQEWTGEANIGDALVTLASRLPQAQMIFTTQGAKGSICLIRAADQVRCRLPAN